MASNENAMRTGKKRVAESVAQEGAQRLVALAQPIDGRAAVVILVPTQGQVQCLVIALARNLRLTSNASFCSATREGP